MNAPVHNEGYQRYVKYAWMFTSVIVLVFGRGLTPWEAIGRLVEDQGVGSETAATIGFVAGYTIPMTVGFIAIFYFLLKVDMNDADLKQVTGVCVGIMIATAVASHLLGLGQILDLSTYYSGVHPALGVPAWVFASYFNVYGFPLMICSLAIAGSAIFTFFTYTEPATLDTALRRLG